MENKARNVPLKVSACLICETFGKSFWLRCCGYEWSSLIVIIHLSFRITVQYVCFGLLRNFNYILLVLFCDVYARSGGRKAGWAWIVLRLVLNFLGVSIMKINALIRDTAPEVDTYGIFLFLINKLEFLGCVISFNLYRDNFQLYRGLPWWLFWGGTFHFHCSDIADLLPISWRNH